MDVPSWIANYISLWLVGFIALIVLVLACMVYVDKKQKAKAPPEAIEDDASVTRQVSTPAQRQAQEFERKLASINLDLDSPPSNE
ncbi:hypothetical protein [Brackiella oedipodis]|uniref:hypothetical protein n=1 Tax=Brackiella oedipodis TaxID=124225 RepID=UPI0004915743|nr:hypothetical protein [Brackiella oedipodis]